MSAAVQLTVHCIEQFRDRFRPGLSAAQAGDELSAMMPCAQLVEEPPGWLADRRRSPDAYLVLGDSLAMPLVYSAGDDDYVAVTCLARGTMAPGERERRRARKSRKR